TGRARPARRRGSPGSTTPRGTTRPSGLPRPDQALPDKCLSGTDRPSTGGTRTHLASPITTPGPPRLVSLATAAVRGRRGEGTHGRGRQRRGGRARRARRARRPRRRRAARRPRGPGAAPGPRRPGLLVLRRAV